MYLLPMAGKLVTFLISGHASLSVFLCSFLMTLFVKLHAAFL